MIRWKVYETLCIMATYGHQLYWLANAASAVIFDPCLSLLSVAACCLLASIGHRTTQLWPL